MRELLAAAAFSILIGLVVFNARSSDDVAPTATVTEIPKLDSRGWPMLIAPAPAPSVAPASRDLFSPAQ